MSNVNQLRRNELKNFISLKNVCTVLGICLFLTGISIAQKSLPAEKAGKIGQPTGKIAFIRNGDVWQMDISGQNQDKVCASANADGRLSWSPDNKTIAFTRSGIVDYKSPDMLGGKHKLYDIFLCYIDSAYANQRNYWYRITNDLGNRGPEWQKDGKRILFWKDMNANKVNAESPNYQICTMEPDGSTVVLLRKDWQNLNMNYLIAPSMNDNGDIVAVYLNKHRQVGMVVMPSGKYMPDMDSLLVVAESRQGTIAPSWSPDGKWIAYISNNLKKSGLFITSADLKETYLVSAPPVSSNMVTLAPSFSPDSKWITYSTNDGSIWIVDITGKGKRRLTGPGPDKNPAWSK